MKKILPHPAREERPKMWRSLNELENSPDFDEWLHREFPRGADVYEDSGLSRRSFVKLMGASMALAGVGLTACRRPEAYLVPFKEGSEWTIPGKFLHYATSMPTRRGAMPLIATTVDGRPTKLEGNPLHPDSAGSTDAFAQASVLDLYDPLRLKEIRRGGEVVDRAALDEYLAAIRARYSGNGEGLAFLVQSNSSPTRDRLRAALEAEFPGLIWAEYEPLGSSNFDLAVETVFGPGVSLVPNLEAADVILSLDSDFLNCAEGGLGASRAFSSRRKPRQNGTPMNRLYVAENNYSLTGGMADHRLRVKASQITDLALALASEVAKATGDGNLAQLVSSTQAGGATFNQDWVRECAADLVAHRGRALVLTGPQQPVQAQLLTLGLNQALQSYGSTLSPFSNPRPASANIVELASAMKDGDVKTLFILEGNPVYNAPADLKFAELLPQVAESIHLTLFEDETSRLSTWQIPAAHYLESWGDGLTSRGVYTSVQPMILPLWGGVPELEILAALSGITEIEGPALIKETFGELVTSGNPDLRWNDFLRLGYLEDSAFVDASASFNSGAASAALAAAGPVDSSGAELVFISSSSTDDGRYSNNSWLQETPDFVTKLTWDNALLVSVADAAKAGLVEGDLVTVTVNGRQLEAGVYIAPGHADGSYSIALGYGRDGLSALMENVGFNAYPVRTSESMRFAVNANLAKTGGKYTFASTQLHHNMEGRDLAREGTLSHFEHDPKFAREIGMDSHLPALVREGHALFTPPELTAKEQWAMAVDLNTCTGCNACLVACRAENNVPVVGKDQISRGRDMAWIRIDRWFAGEVDDPEMVAMSIMCQQCENAPCETVCPVNATVHSEDGLNLMAYNRCIGTRYCANNCPWKVRRFNFFDYNQRPLDKLYWGPAAKKGMADSLKMVKNPNVTVRMRGVMEKCTFCIQRIEEAKIARLVQAGATNKNETPVGPFQTACQQVCPTEAIVFGNQNDKESAVAKARDDDRGYTMFNYVNARSRVTYLARIKNPNMKMPGAEHVGRINTEGHHSDHAEEPIHSGSDHGAQAEA